MAAAGFDEGGLPRRGVSAEAHLERLAVLALLAGSKPAPVEACRVLELGGTGEQLLPLALAYPNSEFVTLDAGEGAAPSNQRTPALGIGNWQSVASEVLPSLGSFDYVLVRGARAWSSLAARDESLWALNRHLAPAGIAYVSFHCAPGALISCASQRLLASYLGGALEPERDLQQVRRVADSLGAALEPAQPITLALKLEFARLARLPEAELRDALALRGVPLYFEDFVQAIAPHALSYFGEAAPGEDDVTRLTSSARDALGEFVNTSTLWQQSLDLFTGSSIRHALVRRASLESSRPPLLSCFERFVFGCAAELELRDGALRLLTRSGATAQISEPALSRAFVQLGRAWPEFLPFSALAELTSRDDPAKKEDRERALADRLYQLFRAGVVEIRVHAPRCIGRPGARPRASELARQMALAGESVINQHQELVHLAEPGWRRLLAACDGERTHEQLAEALPPEAAHEVEAWLDRLARLALLEE